MKPTRAFLRMTLTALFVLALVPLAQAQFRASLRGTVTDPQGAVVSGATVTLVNTSTNQTLVSQTDANGFYQFNALPPAPYRLLVEAKGFQQKVLEKVNIIPEQANGLDVRLELATVQQKVTVSATTEAVNTESATISGTISSNQVQNMPSFGRDVYQLVQLTPGVFGDGSQGAGGGANNLPGTQGPGATGGNQGIFQTENGPQALAVGQQYENNNYSIDGISTTSAVWGGTTIITPSEDSVQEVHVDANSYDAENGRFSGAQVQVISKSGTNRFHGSAFFTAHRPGLNAFQPFNGQGNKVLRDTNFFDQVGGSVGGPIWKNKIFFFFAYETVLSPAAQRNFANQWFETASFEHSALPGSIAAQYLSFAGSAPNVVSINNATCADAGLSEGVNCRTIPGQGLDVGSPLTSGLGNQDLSWAGTGNPGVGNGLDGVADIANFLTESSSHVNKAQWTGRIDALVSSKDRLSGAIYWVPQSSSFLNGPARQYNFFNHEQTNNAFSAIWDHTFSPTMLNEFRVNAAGWRWNEITSNPQAPVGLPTDFIDTTGTISVSQFGPNVGSILNQWTYGYKDVATKVTGRHTIKFGGELTRLFYLSDCPGCGVPHYNFFNLWDFLNDAPHAEGAAFDPNTGIPTIFRQDDRANIWGLFVQDDLKVRPNLTLTAGLRWEYFGPLRSKENNMFVAIPGAGASYLTGLTVVRGKSWNAQKDNFGPHIGFAWSPGRFHDRLVVRGGYGLSYNQEEIAVSSSIAANPGLVVFSGLSMSTPTTPNPGILYATASSPTSLFGYPPNPNFIVAFGPNGLPTTGSVPVAVFPRDFPTMRVHHYSLLTEYDLGHDFVVSLGYQGSLSRNIYFHENVNAVPATSGFPLNPQISGGDYWGVSGWGNYNAMLAEVRHRFSHQFMADAQFTWAKSMDTSSGPYFEQPYPYNLNLDYGRSDYNVGKALKLFGIYQPVIFRGHNWVEKIAGGWSISGIFNLHGGFPWSPVMGITGGNLYCGTCGYTTLFPAASLGGFGTSTSNSSFQTVPGSNFPNGGPAYFTGPSYTAFSGSAFGTALPTSPGVHRNSLTGPGYRDVDMSLVKSFGLPTMRGLGEEGRIEFRLDAYNVFNSENLTNVSNFICTIDSTGTCLSGSANPHFGLATAGLAGRVVTLGARFTF